MPVTLLGAAEIRALAADLDVTPTKKLGQNFVVDANTVRKIVHVSKVEPGDRVVEVGPGLGSLTLAILEAGATVTAVEIDHRLAERLPVTAAAHGVAAGALTVVDADALRVTTLPGDPTVLVANLPYNVSVPVLLHFLETFPGLERGVVMVQAEVGERLAAPPGSKVYGAPSVKAAWYGPWRLAGTVSRQVFWPVPNVDSVLVAFERDPAPRGSEQERRRTFAIVDAAFQQRRKMLRQALSAVLRQNPQPDGVSSATASEVLESAGVAPTARAARSSRSTTSCGSPAWSPDGGFRRSPPVLAAFTKHAGNVWRARPGWHERHQGGEREERMRLAEYPAPERVLLHLSDTHLRAAGSRLFDLVDATNRLQRALAAIEASGIAPDGIVFTGDLVDLGQGDAYAELRAIVDPFAARLGTRVFWVMGNHDDRAAFRSRLLGERSTDPASPIDRVDELDGLRLVTLDSTVPGFHHGELRDDQLAWLADVLATPAPLGTILAMHHPPVPSVLPLAATVELRDQARLADALRGTDVRAIIAGHLHYSTFATFIGIPVSVASSTCYAQDLTVPVGGTRPQDGAQAFNLVHVYDHTIVHSVVAVDAPHTLEHIDADEARRRIAAAGIAAAGTAAVSSPPTEPIGVLR